jgi:hypothetical protein
VRSGFDYSQCSGGVHLGQQTQPTFEEFDARFHDLATKTETVILSQGDHAITPKYLRSPFWRKAKAEDATYSDIAQRGHQNKGVVYLIEHNDARIEATCNVVQGSVVAVEFVLKSGVENGLHQFMDVMHSEFQNVKLVVK